MTINNTLFYNNLAEDGGAIHMFSESTNYLAVNITGVNFTKNKAAVSGGAIYYDSFVDYGTDNFLSIDEDSVISNCQGKSSSGAIHYAQTRPEVANEETLFDSNSAPYGNNWGSYPVELVLVQDSSAIDWLTLVNERDGSGRLLLESTTTTTLKNRRLSEEEEDGDNSFAFASGQTQIPPLLIALYDQEGQAVSTWEDAEGTITFGTSQVVTRSELTFGASGGYIIFYPLIASYTPGQNTTASISASISQVSGLSSRTQSLNIDIAAPFRECVRGERHTDNDECFICEADTYIL